MKLLAIFDLVPGWLYAIAVALLLAGAAFTSHAWLAARDEVAALTVQRDQAISTAAQCSESVAKLQSLAAKRAKDGRPAIAAAASQAMASEQRADQILAAPASTPGDDCKSAQDQVSSWLASGSKP